MQNVNVKITGVYLVRLDLFLSVTLILTFSGVPLAMETPIKIKPSPKAIESSIWISSLNYLLIIAYILLSTF